MTTPHPHSTRRRLGALLLGLLFLLSAAACGKDSEVGSGVKVDEDGRGGAFRDPATTTSSTSTTLSSTASTQKASVTTTTKPPTTTTTTPAAIVIKIQDDEQGVAFDPPQIRVKQGAIIEWKNVGVKKPRQIEAQDRAFKSPPIPPGGTFRWTANVAGTHNYRDTTRPYAVAGKVQVG